MTERVDGHSGNAPGGRDSLLGFRGLWECFLSPVSFFAKLKQSPRVLVPYLVVLAGYLLSMFLLGDIIAEVQLDQLKQSGRVTPGQMPTAEAIKGSAIIFGVIFLGLSPLVLAGLGVFWGNFIFAGKATFKQLLSIMLYGEWIYVLFGLPALALILAKGELTGGLSLAVFLESADVQNPLFTLLSKFSLQHVGEAIVVGIGLEQLYAVPRNKGYLLAVLTVGLLALVHVLASVVGAMFT